MTMHVFLSPHFDDAVYSCGGLIHQLTAADKSVKIVTVMAGDIPEQVPDTPLVRELHARWQAGTDPISTRRREDEAAAEVLKAGMRHMDLPDCVYRMSDAGALYPDGDEDIFGPIKEDDPAKTILATTPIPYADCATHIYAPMAIGNHVDHVLVRDWALTHANTHALTLYADYPYSSQPATITTTLANIADNYQLEDQLITLSDANFEAKFAAALCYRSQVSTFWPDEKAMRAAIYTYLYETGNGTLAERYWRLIR